MEDNWPKAWPNVVELLDEVHIFDPNGDVLLQLKKIPVNTSTVGETPLVPDEILEPEPADKEDITLVETSPLEPQVDDDSLDFQAPIWTGEDDAVEGEATQLTMEDELAPDVTLNVYLRVSSRHLILASAMFNNMLGSDTFAEGKEFRSKGNLVVKLSDDPEALIILMNIIHMMTRKVPRNVNLDTLAKLANVVNYYQLHEAVEPFSDTWIANLKQEAFPKSYNPEVVSWLFISWVFQKGDDFEEMTKVLVCESDDKLLDDIERENVPIPASISQRIQEHRNEAIESIITILHDYIARYMASDILCSEGHQFACDAIVLGSLLKSSLAIGIWPRPKVPYHGITFNSLASEVREMQVLDTCNRRDRYYSSGNGHGIKNAIEASIRSLEDHFCGFKLDSFLPETQSRRKRRSKKQKNKGARITWD